MSHDLFVTGMIRSGTSLVQVLLTNHPDMFVAYQPFHQLYVGAKARFLAETGHPRALPLGDGHDEAPGEAAAFRSWLERRRFDQDEADRLAAEAVLGKGGSVPHLSGSLPVTPGTFADLRTQLLAGLVDHFGASDVAVTGSKEVLCEEYVPRLHETGSQAVVVVRDPRAVVSSAGSGSYLRMVGDRYPVLMLVRLWRKSARIALSESAAGRAHRLRYEDVATDPAGQLDAVAAALGLAPFPGCTWRGPLLDHAGEVWTGNSSHGPQQGVDPTAASGWVDRLAPDVAAFIEATCLPELEALGYPTTMNDRQARRTIEEFVEDESGVRASYLDMYRLDDARRAEEIERSELQSA